MNKDACMMAESWCLQGLNRSAPTVSIMTTTLIVGPLRIAVNRWPRLRSSRVMLSLDYRGYRVDIAISETILALGHSPTEALVPLTA